MYGEVTQYPTMCKHTVYDFYMIRDMHMFLMYATYTTGDNVGIYERCM